MESSYVLPSDRRQQSRSLEKRQGNRRFMDRLFLGTQQANATAIRYLVYILITAIIIEGLVLSTYYLDAIQIFSENNPVEWFQFFLLLACSISLQVTSLRTRELREIFHLFALLPLAASVREMDINFDLYLFDGAWQLTVIILALYAFYLGWYHWQELNMQIPYVLVSRPLGIIFSGFLTVMVFSRLMGQQVFWEGVLEDDYVRTVGRVVEESGELLGYLLLLFGCVELLFGTVSRGSAEQDIQRNSHEI